MKEDKSMEKNIEICERCGKAPAVCRVRSDVMDMAACSSCAVKATAYEGPIGKMTIEKITKQRKRLHVRRPYFPILK
ncbi:MAG: hypothetical protein ACE5J1_03155, partial [Nitrospiria bacterium]